MDFIKEKCIVIKRDQYKQVLENDEKKVILRYLIDPIGVTS